MKPIPLVAFAPDSDPTQPGLVVDCSFMIPTPKGLKSAPALAPAGLPALSAACTGAALLFELDGTTRLFAGTASDMYESSAATWSDVSRAGNYTSGTNRWRFCQLGNTAFATNKADAMQYSTTGNFADVTGPKASIIFTVNDQVMALSTNDATYGDNPDGWWASKYLDGTNWTLSVADKCVRGRLVSTPGGFTAGRALGSVAVAYKDRSVYVGLRVDTDSVWQWTLITGAEGAPSQEAVVDIGGAHIYPGYSDFWLFDGTRPVPVGEGIKEWFFSRLNSRYRSNIQGAHDFTRNLVYFFYPSTESASGAIDSGVVYNYRTGKWGRYDVAIEACIESLVTAITYATLDDFFATYGDITTTYDSAFWRDAAPVVAVFNTSHVPKTMTGSAEDCSFTTWNFGDDEAESVVQRVTLRYVKAPTSGTMTNYYAQRSGGAFNTGTVTTESDGAFDLLRSARWHRFTFDMSGECEVTHILLTGTGAGFK